MLKATRTAMTTIISTDMSITIPSMDMTIMGMSTGTTTITGRRR